MDDLNTPHCLTLPSTPGFVLGHRPALDGLRGVALLTVLGLHFLPGTVRGGFIGVDLFFVLSGFLITVLLLQEHQRSGAVSLRSFYWRRGVRLMPPLLCVLAVSLLGALFFAPKYYVAALLRDSLWVLVNCYNWRLAWAPNAIHPTLLGPMWSLAVEEQFYLAWPLLLVLMLRLKLRRRWIVVVTAGGVVLSAALRSIAFSTGVDGVRIYVGTDMRMDGVLLGCVVAFLIVWGRGPRSAWGKLLLRAAAWVCAAAFIGYALYVDTAIQVITLGVFIYRYGGYTLISVCGAVVIAAQFWAPPRLLNRVLESAALRWVGRISYGGYLWQGAIYQSLIYLTGGSHLRSVSLLAAAGSLTAGAMSHYYLERPLLRWRDRRRTAEPPRRCPHSGPPSRKQVKLIIGLMPPISPTSPIRLIGRMGHMGQT